MQGDRRPGAARTQLAHAITVRSEDGLVSLTFDLRGVQMSREQEAIVLKLFSQDPIAEVAVEEHLHSRERGKEGPGSKYLSFEEFESIRELGVRLGTGGDLVAAQCDFCLHCVKLEATPTWRGGFGEAAS